MTRAMVFVLLVAAASSASASAEIYRCKAPGASIAYQEQPCDAAAPGGAVAIPTEFPDYLEARNRLAAREAAADARIVERLRIESAERIARDERAAREAQLQAERERVAPSEVWVPVYIGGPVRAKPLPRRDRLHGRSQPHSLPLMR